MRRIVFQLDDDPDVKGEVGLDNEGNIYLRGAVGKSIRLLQDTAGPTGGGDYVPEAFNLLNINSIEFISGGYVVMGKQVLVTLLFYKDVPDPDSQSEFDVTLPITPKFTGEAAEAAAVFTSHDSFTASPGYFIATPVPETNRVKIFHGTSPVITGLQLHQVGFSYRIP